MIYHVRRCDGWLSCVEVLHEDDQVLIGATRNFAGEPIEGVIGIQLMPRDQTKVVVPVIKAKRRPRLWLLWRLLAR